MLRASCDTHTIEMIHVLARKVATTKEVQLRRLLGRILQGAAKLVQPAPVGLSAVIHHVRSMQTRHCRHHNTQYQQKARSPAQAV